MVRFLNPADSAALLVSSRAIASNDAGTVTSTSCLSKGVSECSASHAARRCFRYCADASTGDMRAKPSAAFQGNMAAVRSTDEYDSQLFADDTRRLEISAPRRCASLPVT